MAKEKDRAHETSLGSGTKEHRDDPAQKFFRDFATASWSIENYLSANRDLVSDSFERLLACWARELDRLKKTGDSNRAKKEATRLWNRYKDRGKDWEIARKTRDAVQANNAHPSIVITGNTDSNIAVNSTQNISDAAAGKRKREAKQPKSSTASKKTKRPASAPTFLKHFRKEFVNMSREKKWLLPSGQYAEDVLFERFKTAPKELAVHSWIIDTCDETIQKCFGEIDWKEICGQLAGLPALDRDLVKWVLAFSNVPVSELRDHLDTIPPVSPTELTSTPPETRSARAWVYDVLRCWTHLCDSPSVFTQNHREFWYVANIWNIVFDRCMTTLRGAYMSRGESMSVSATARKNLTADAPQRRRVGHLYDGVLRLHDAEVGAAEHGRTWNSQSSAKWAHDTLKVQKVLHDMLYEMGERARGVQVVGLVTAGWKCQLMRVGYAKGYLCLSAMDKVRKIPAPGEGVVELLLLCGAVWKFKSSLSSTVAATTFVSAAGLEELMNETPAQARTVLIPRSVETDASCASGEEWSEAGVCESEILEEDDESETGTKDM